MTIPLMMIPKMNKKTTCLSLDWLKQVVLLFLLNCNCSYVLHPLYMPHRRPILSLVVRSSYGTEFLTIWPPTEPASREVR